MGRMEHAVVETEREGLWPPLGIQCLTLEGEKLSLVQEIQGRMKLEKEEVDLFGLGHTGLEVGCHGENSLAMNI